MMVLIEAEKRHADNPNIINLFAWLEDHPDLKLTTEHNWYFIKYKDWEATIVAFKSIWELQSFQYLINALIENPQK